MAYSTDLASAARRHLQAAQRLDDGAAPVHLQKRDVAVAGYLYGVAGECAVKQIMRQANIRPLPVAERRDDPYYAHFPALRRMLLDTLCGRRSAPLRAILEDGGLMSEWSTDMRYAPAKDVLPRHVTRWRKDAQRLVGAMESG